METPLETGAFFVSAISLSRAKGSGNLSSDPRDRWRTRILVQPKGAHANGTEDCGGRVDCRAWRSGVCHLEAGTYGDSFGEEEGGGGADGAGRPDSPEDRTDAGAVGGCAGRTGAGERSAATKRL